MKSIESKLKALTEKIQQLVDLEFAKLDGKPAVNSALDQLNLRGGNKVIYECLEHSEYGLVFDHLIYMIEETGIELSAEVQASLHEVSELMSDT